MVSEINLPAAGQALIIWTFGKERMKMWTVEKIAAVQLPRLLVLCTGRLYPPADIPGIHLCYRLGRPQDYRVVGRFKSTKYPSNPIGNQNRDFPAFSAVSQLTAPPHKMSGLC
jgi:hypothetical protein